MSTNKYKAIKYISYFVISIIALFFFCLYGIKIEYKRIESPDKQHIAVVTYRLYNVLIPRFPGGSGDKSGFVTIYNSNNKKLGSFPIDMVWQANEITWTPTKAYIKLQGEVDLEK